MLSVFPGGILPTLSLLIDSLCSACKGKLVVDSVNNIGPHYARTLREWRRRFLDQFDDVIVPALKAEYPSMVSRDQWLNEIEVFKRKWLCECAEIGHLLVLICFSCRLLLLLWDWIYNQDSWRQGFYQISHICLADELMHRSHHHICSRGLWRLWLWHLC